MFLSVIFVLVVLFRVLWVVDSCVNRNIFYVCYRGVEKGGIEKLWERSIVGMVEGRVFF